MTEPPAPDTGGASAPSLPPWPELPPLPSAAGPLGHLRYTLAALRLQRLLRQHLDAHDAALRAAVADRDDQLVALGEATLLAPTLEARATAFQHTLAVLDSEQATAARAHEALQVEYAGAEADRRAAEARFDVRLEELRALLRPVERRLERTRREAETLRRELDAQASQALAIEQRIAREHQALDAETDPAARARLAEEHARHLEALDRVNQARAAVEQRRLAVVAPLERDEGERAALQAEVIEAETERQVVVGAAATRQEALKGEVDEAHRRLDALDARRRAALMDLGREMIEAHPSATGEGHTAARAALAHIAAIRRARTRLETQRGAIDLAPVRRTALVAGLSVLFLLCLWWFR